MVMMLCVKHTTTALPCARRQNCSEAFIIDDEHKVRLHTETGSSVSAIKSRSSIHLPYATTTRNALNHCSGHTAHVLQLAGYGHHRNAMVQKSSLGILYLHSLCLHDLSRVGDLAVDNVWFSFGYPVQCKMRPFTFVTI